MVAKKYNIEKLRGSKFNRVTITGEITAYKKGRLFTFICECGNAGKATPHHIVKSIVVSWGCYKLEKALENLKEALKSPLLGRHARGILRQSNY